MFYYKYIMEVMNDFGWVIIYVSAFGISDYVVKKYIKSDMMYIFYYLLLGCIGLYFIF